MEKRVLGIILSILGIAGLIYAGISFLNGGTGQKNIKAIIFAGGLGAIFFFAGISLVRNTKDKATQTAGNIFSPEPAGHDKDDNKFCDLVIAGKAGFPATNDTHFNGVKLNSFPVTIVVSEDRFMIIPDSYTCDAGAGLLQQII